MPLHVVLRPHLQLSSKYFVCVSSSNNVTSSKLTSGGVFLEGPPPIPTPEKKIVKCILSFEEESFIFTWFTSDWLVLPVYFRCCVTAMGRASAATVSVMRPQCIEENTAMNVQWVLFTCVAGTWLGLSCYMLTKLPQVRIWLRQKVFQGQIY